MAKRIVDILRHGRYIKPGGRLDEMGVRQVEHAVQRFEGATHLECSTMDRALHTAEILSTGLGLVPRRRHNLREALPSIHPEHATFVPPQHVVDDSKRRMEKMVEELTRPARGSDKYVVVAAHGNVMRYLWTRALGWPPLAWWDLACPFHAAVSRFEVRPDGRVVGQFYNDVSHLPDDLRTVD